ncbi:hypothetical protein PoB_005520900 [Plakobranchus ocellatus]|uniref:Uncharacterized protein n=1 Tax=Plakobranchus ocellatus TaxID=259542 RepID=A0AAV4CC56_9GAST|nr:hypothetical protein PoB_005520900 [Plakobranchus ocellatus]
MLYQSEGMRIPRNRRNTTGLRACAMTKFDISPWSRVNRRGHAASHSKIRRHDIVAVPRPVIKLFTEKGILQTDRQT